MHRVMNIRVQKHLQKQGVSDLKTLAKRSEGPVEGPVLFDVQAPRLAQEFKSSHRGLRE